MKKMLAAPAVILLLTGCDQGPNTESQDYKAGYEAGQVSARSDLCNQIQGFSDRIYEAIREEGICS